MANREKQQEESLQECQVRESREQLIAPEEFSRAEAEDPLRSGSPLAVIRRFSEDLDQLFESFFGADWPNLEVSETDDKLIVQARLSGLQKEDILVELRGSELWISTKHCSEVSRQGPKEPDIFHRTVRLPKRVSADAVSASFEEGILRIEVDTARDAVPCGRRIEVRSGRTR